MSDTQSTGKYRHQPLLPSHTASGTYDDPHVEISPAISVQGPRTVGLVARDTDVVESLGKADTRPVGTLGLELQGHEATEAIQEGGRGAGSVEGRGTTETTRSPARSGIAAGVSRIIGIFFFVD
jgi:hypothetical protein